jgi:superoxide oxidase
MQKDFSLDQVSECETAAAGYVPWHLGRFRPALDRRRATFPTRDCLVSENASAQRLMGDADMSADFAGADMSRPPFDSVTICLHWATVLFVLAMFTSAELRSQTHDDGFKAILLQIHRSLGVTIWVATALRLAWRMTSAKLPPFPANMTKMHRAVVQLSEYGLYALLLGQPVTGLGATLFSGRPFALFLWQIPQLMPEDKALRATLHLAHELGEWGLGALAAGHAAAALIHYFVLREDVLQCMVPAISTARRRREPSPGRVIREGTVNAQ